MNNPVILYSHGMKMVIFSWLLLDETAVRIICVLTVEKSSQIHGGSHLCSITYSDGW